MPAFPRTSLRDLASGAERFARALPSLASTLARPVPEPMTERLVDGVSVLAATVLDKARDFQRFAYEVVAERCSPWLRRPVPAATILALEPPAEGRLTVRSSTVLHGAPVEGIRCTFRPTRDVVVTAFRADEARIESRPGRPTVVRVRLQSTGLEPVNAAISDGVALYVDGDRAVALQIVHALTTAASRVVLESPFWDAPIEVDPRGVTRGELGAEAALAPDPDGRPSAFGIVAEAAYFPDKFRFFRLPELPRCRTATPAQQITLSFHLRDSSLAEARLGGGDIRAHCVPVVNLFEASAEPLRLDVEQGDLPVRIAGLSRRGGGVYAVSRAVATAEGGEHPPVPLADVRRLSAARSDPRCEAVFATSFTAVPHADPEMTVAFGQREGAPFDDVARVVSLDVLATNRALASRLRAGDLAGTLAVAGHMVGFRSVAPASPYLPPPTGDSFALRVLRAARVPEGARDPLLALKDALFQSVPSWVGREEWVRAQHVRIQALEALEVTVARRVGADGSVRRGYAYRLIAEESGFRGAGDLGLFGAALGEALARSAPIGTFVELSLVGRKGTFEATFPKRVSA